MALVNSAGLNPVIVPVAAATTGGGGGGGGGKDSRWLTLEVCREFARSKCSRSEEECKYAHPPPHVEIQNGRVTCCFDSIKGKCQRKEPPCKYLHPPQHLKEILLQNGRQNLIFKNFQMQATTLHPLVQMPSMYPTVKSDHNEWHSWGGRAQKRAAAAAAAANAASTNSLIQAANYPNVMMPGYFTMLQPQGGATHQYQLMSAQPSPAGYPSYFTQINTGATRINGVGYPTALYHSNTGVDPSNSSVASLSIPAGSMSAAMLQMAVNGINQQNLEQKQQQQLNAVKYLENISNGSSMPTSSTAMTSNSQISTATSSQSWAADESGSSSTSPNNSVTIESMSPYGQPVYYKRQVVEVMAGGGLSGGMATGGVLTAGGGGAGIGVGGGCRKRAYDASDELHLGMNTMAGLVPVIKRPALVEAKSGLPVYHHTLSSATYEQAAMLAAMQQLQQQQQFVPYTIPVAGHGPVIPRF